MKYRTMRFNGLLGPNSEAVIYIIPVSSDPGAYRVIYPHNLGKKLSELVIKNNLSIKMFEGCSEGALPAVKKKLVEMLNQWLERYSVQMNSLFLVGVALTILGLIDWTVPDPLPLVDELVFTVLGVALAYTGFSSRKKKLPEYADRAELAERSIASLEASTDPLMSRIYKSIQAKEEPELEKLNGLTELDRLDLESEWLVKYINIGEMIRAQAITADEAKEIMSVLQSIIPMKKMVKLEERGLKFGGRGKLKRIRKRAAEKGGISAGVLTVYCEFYKSAREYFNSLGEEF